MRRINKPRLLPKIRFHGTGEGKSSAKYISALAFYAGHIPLYAR
jgi:hypothetical protein